MKGIPPAGQQKDHLFSGISVGSDSAYSRGDASRGLEASASGGLEVELSSPRTQSMTRLLFKRSVSSTDSCPSSTAASTDRMRVSWEG
jgi:hypothetical protein